MRKYQREGLSDRNDSVLDYGSIAVKLFILMAVSSVFHLIAKTIGIVCQALECGCMWQQQNTTVETVKLRGTAYTKWTRHQYNTIFIFRYSGLFPLNFQ